MSLDVDKLVNHMESLLNDIIIEEKISSLQNLKSDLLKKNMLLKTFIGRIKKQNIGKLSSNFISELQLIQDGFIELYDNFDDKLMIFIIGNGNVGKSTLLNSLIGYKVAKTNVLPTTWKIDVYSPEIDEKSAVIKYITGKKETLPINTVKNIVEEEEQKTKESKKNYNDNLKKELKGLSTKEEREEMKAYLGEKYLYKSDISEVRWPVEANWILEKCLLVDTPGLNQDLNHIGQLGNIHDYYHKADGVLWLLDGQTIAAANAKSLLEELDTVLDTVGGVRNNIIGVINRIDLVKNNGGDQAVEKVLEDARGFFGDKFCNIVNISAQEAFTGISQKESEMINSSGILNLQNAIRELFISKAETVKNNAKEQGCSKLVGMTLIKLEEYQEQIQKYEKTYLEKEEKLDSLTDEYIDILVQDIENFFESYLNEVSRRVDINIDALAEGNGAEFIKDKMYAIDDFTISLRRLLDNKELEIKNNYVVWEKVAKISEYRYIKNVDLNISENLPLTYNFNFQSLNNIEYFTPYTGDNLFSLVGNVLGKGMFLLRKNSIKCKINNSVQERCYEIQEGIIELLLNSIDEEYQNCLDILDSSFESILFSYENIDKVKKSIQELEREMNKEQKHTQLKNIIL